METTSEMITKRDLEVFATKRDLEAFEKVVNAKFDTVDAKFDAVIIRIDNLEKLIHHNIANNRWLIGTILLGLIAASAFIKYFPGGV